MWDDVTGEEQDLRERASRKRRQEFEVSIFKAAWYAAAWINGGLPDWPSVLRMLRGEPEPQVTLEEQVRFGKRLARRGLGTWEDGPPATAPAKEATRGR